MHLQLLTGPLRHFRRPAGEWICVDARTYIGLDGGGLAESTLFDESGLISRATQSLAVRARS